jgi:hypothetical protein
MSSASLAAAALALLTAIGAAAQQSETALQRAGELEDRAESALKAGDAQGRIVADLELLQLLNGSPAVLEALARAYVAVGRPQRALATLDQIADLGLADDAVLSGKDRRFETLDSRPQYKRVLSHWSGNEAPVLLSKIAFTLPDAGLLAEDIDYDARSRSFLVTSVREHKIIRVRPDGTAADFAVSPDGWPMVALKIDASRQRVWATEVAFDGLAVAPRVAWGHSAVLTFDLESGRLLRRIEAPLHSSLGDLALTSLGEPVVSDGDNGVLYLVSHERLTELDRADFISPQTAAVAPAPAISFVPDYTRGIARFDLRSGHAEWLNQDGGDKVAIIGIDGLYLHGRTLIATQNGVTPERVVLFGLDPSLTHIVSSRVIEQSGATGTDPTHGVVVGDAFYYIANSGWAQLDEHGNERAGARLTPARVMRYAL